MRGTEAEGTGAKSPAKVPARDLLGPEAAEVIESISDLGLRARVYRALAVCDEALRAVDALNLAEHEVGESNAPDLSVWNALAPDVRHLMVSVKRASSVLKDLFPPTRTEDVLMTFDVDEAFSQLVEGLDAPPPVRDERENEIQRIVSQTTDIRMAQHGVHQLATMLHDDFVALARRLRNPKVVADKWLLLADLQELKAKCVQCLEAVVAALVRPFTREPLTAILPRYADATARALVLREKLVDLGHDVGRLNDKVQRCDNERAVAVRHALSVRLGAFVKHEAYGYLRPADKREMSMVRTALNDYDHEVEDLAAFRALVEGFAKFLDVLRSINQRDVLLQHDVQKLQTAMMMIDAEADDASMQPVLLSLYGRDVALDEMIRSFRRGEVVDRTMLYDALERAHLELAL